MEDLLGVFTQSPIVSRITHFILSNLFSGNPRYGRNLLLRCLFLYLWIQFYISYGPMNRRTMIVYL